MTDPERYAYINSGGMDCLKNHEIRYRIDQTLWNSTVNFHVPGEMYMLQICIYYLSKRFGRSYISRGFSFRGENQDIFPDSVFWARAHPGGDQFLSDLPE